MMDVGLSLPLRILLLLNHRKDGGVFFKEIVEHVNRDKGQVSNVLKRLANDGLIVKGDAKPQRITITDLGKEKVDYFLKDITHQEKIKEEEKDPQKYRIPVLDKQEVFNLFISKLAPRIKEDLGELSHYITADALDLIQSQIIETVENSLYSVFSKIYLMDAKKMTIK